MRVGFTGTRDGMTEPQEAAFLDWCEVTSFREFHHGCCVGSDERAAAFVDTFGEERPVIHGHPSNLRGMTSPKAVRVSDNVSRPKSPLYRNRDIVDACDILLACPKGPEERRSGTWATIRYARKIGRLVKIIQPDGTIE
jgi:hypothetical protein